MYCQDKHLQDNPYVKGLFGIFFKGRILTSENNEFRISLVYKDSLGNIVKTCDQEILTFSVAVMPLNTASFYVLCIMHTILQTHISPPLRKTRYVFTCMLRSKSTVKIFTIKK